ncbi:6,7-dimethyl-8-ribityllumazine synthase [Corynebacterium pacaense]|uniref:6,7-dimethyl-8-ribityllumazine synthase n=1 Tax=Corynebacterium pacaense TaxID=1816684 RepID=UPI0009B9EC9F|nr:6,7-dimethyl-8-ribityllumazine synthase [Corynebacterium pacaense]
MAKEGLPRITLPDAGGLQVAVVSARWNAEICQRMHERAVDTGCAAGATVSEYHVVGALELPVVVQELSRSHDAVVAIGCVIRGGTPHFDYVCDSVTQGLTRIALDSGVPIGNGVLTVNTEDQAIERSGGEGSLEDKGAEAMIAALDTALVLSGIRARRG